MPRYAAAAPGNEPWERFSAGSGFASATRLSGLKDAEQFEDPGALAVARERSDGRDVAVPHRRRRTMPALLDDASQAGAGDPRVAELGLDDLPHASGCELLRWRLGSGGS